MLFRKGIDHEHEVEFEVAKTYFHIAERRSLCPPNSLVVCRYSALPFYKELEDDLRANGSRLINTWEQHNWIADMGWAMDLAEHTFPTYTDQDFHKAPEGPYVVKGRTNSRKSHWSTHMFAESKRAAVDVAGRLLSDPLIAQQGLVYRKYEPLVTYEIGINGQRFTNEWRFFYLGHKLLGHGRYWTTATHPEKATMDNKGMAFAQKVAEEVMYNASFFVLDIGQKVNGDWILIECNDGQQAGLSENHPEVLYHNLKTELVANTLWCEE